MYNLIGIHIHDKTNNSNDSTVNENSFSSFAGERFVHEQTDTELESLESKREENISPQVFIRTRSLCLIEEPQSIPIKYRWHDHIAC